MLDDIYNQVGRLREQMEKTEDRIRLLEEVCGIGEETKEEDTQIVVPYAGWTEDGLGPEERAGG